MCWLRKTFSLGLFLALLLPMSAWAAVLYDGEVEVSGTTTGTTDLTLASKTTAGSNRIGFVALAWQDEGVAVSTITWNGVGMTVVNSDRETGYGLRSSLYYILNPPTAGSSIVVHWAATIAGARGTAFSVNGADVSGTPLGTSVTAHTAGGQEASPSTVTVTTASGELVVDSLSWSQSDVTAPVVGADQTQIKNNTFNDGFRFGAASYQDGANGGVMSWTFSSTAAWAIVAVPVKSATATPHNGMLLGVGQ